MVEDKRIYYEDGKKIYIYILNRNEWIGWHRIDDLRRWDKPSNCHFAKRINCENAGYLIEREQIAEYVLCWQ